ncbi:MAG: SRPBCC family protein [Acidobacteriaceae bacterium]
MDPVKEIVFERTFDAPTEKVWEAWTDPKILKQWWGPNDVIIPECEVDLRVGGRFYLVMEAGPAMGPYKGTRWPMEAKYTEVEPGSKLAYAAKAWTEGYETETQIDQATELSMTEEDPGKTKLELKATINKFGPGAQMAVEGMQYGFTQQLDKLKNFLAK